MDINRKSIILASGSPRRRELLEGLDVRFEVDVKNDFEETYDPDTPHEMIPEVLAEGKSRGFHRDLGEGEILITSDTLVLCGNDVMGKPDGREEAIRMLKQLSGRSHKVITAVTVRDSNRMKTVSDTVVVHFKELKDREIEYYVDNYRPYDKAGAYGIQEWIGYMGIDRIEGSYFTVMGLPVHLVYDLLAEFTPMCQTR